DAALGRLAIRRLTVGSAVEAVGCQVVTGEGSGQAAVILFDAELYLGQAADASTNPGDFAIRVEGPPCRATIARPNIVPAGHELDWPSLDRLLGPQVKDGQLIVVRPGTASVTEEMSVGGIIVPANLTPAGSPDGNFQVDPLVDGEVRPKARVARRID